MQEKVYDILMIDPPWEQKKGGNRKVRPMQGQAFDYSTMPVDAIFKVLDSEVFPMAQDSHIMFMWTIEKYLLQCETSVLSRGYRRHCRLVWNKLNGVAPAFTVRFAHEYLIWYYKGRFMPVNEHMRGRLSTVFTERARQHSRKPDMAYKIIESLYPLSRKLDVFSREKRDGWDQFGNEVDYFKNN